VTEEEPVPEPGVTRPDLSSIRAATQQTELAGTARGGLTADSHPPTGEYPLAPPATGIDRAIRLSTAAAVLAVAGIAAYISYWHAYAVVRAHGETGITARLEPATIDGLVYASSMIVLYAARHRVPVPSLARWLLGLGIATTLTANMAQGWSHGPIGAVVAAWPAVSLVGSYELLVWLIRISGPAARGPSALHRCKEAPGLAWRPAGQSAGQSPILASGQRDDEVLEASTVNNAAVAAYQLSVQAGNPLSERRLAQMFGRTSRRWARARIAEARQASPLLALPSTLVPAYAGGLGRSAGQALPACPPSPKVTMWPDRSSCPRLSVVSWLKDSGRPPVQDCTRASMRPAAWKPATSAPAVTTTATSLHDCRDSSPVRLR
jgi:hypothetical protein